MSEVNWIAADWGTSRLRVWAMDADDQVMHHASSNRGMGSLEPDEFEGALLELVGGWLSEDRVMPVVACGMVGARQGWVEARYVSIPCPPLGAGLTPAPCNDPRLSVGIISGIKYPEAPDVMRGEETQVAGFLADAPEFDGFLCLPGTHTKWVHIRRGEIQGFRTCMSGEMFALFEKHSTLRHSIAGDTIDEEVFRAQIYKSFDAPLVDLFQIRAGDLLNGTPPAEGRARLSAALICSEVQQLAKFVRPLPVMLVGAPALARLYEIALDVYHIKTTIVDADAVTLAGLRAARAMMEAC